LGDLRDLKRFASLAGDGPQAKKDKAKKHPPGYRRRKEKLLGAALASHREIATPLAGSILQNSI
jgi:hypothetical protein